MERLTTSEDLVEMSIELPDDQMMIMQPFSVVENPMHSLNTGQHLILEDSSLNDISLLSHNESSNFDHKKVTFYPQTIVLNEENETFNSKNKKGVEITRVVHKIPQTDLF